MCFSHAVSRLTRVYLLGDAKMKTAFFIDQSYSRGQKVQWGGNKSRLGGQNSHPDHAISETQRKPQLFAKAPAACLMRQAPLVDVRQPPQTKAKREKVRRLMTVGRHFPLFREQERILK